MKAQEKFNVLKPQYEKVYEANHGKEIFSLEYRDGWCFLLTSEYSMPSKFRVNKLETMVATLQKRIALQRDKENQEAKEQFLKLPKWLQELWELDYSIARKAEKDYHGGLSVEETEDLSLKDFPQWVSELWEMDSTLARKAERYFTNRVVGYKVYRHSQSPDEKLLHNTFIKEHIENNLSGDDGSFIVFGHGDSMMPNDYLSHREKRIVASTIQWLGSSVGQSFLESCGFVKEK